MSRKAAKPIEFDDSVNLDYKDNQLKVKGPKGELFINILDGIELKIEDKKIYVTKKDDSKNHIIFAREIPSGNHFKTSRGTLVSRNQ